MLVQSAFFGRKGSGAYDFASAPQAVTVGGQSSFTLTAGVSVWSDPVEGVITAGQDVVFCYDAVGGSGRAYARASASGHNLYFLSGLGGAGNASLVKSGYSVVSGLTAVIAGIEVAAALADLNVTPPPPSGDDEEPASGVSGQDWGIAAIKADQIYARGDFIEGVDGQCLHVNLCAQAGQKAVYLWGIEVTPSVDTRFSLRALLPVQGWESIPAICNADFREGAPYATARLFKGYSPTILGGKHSVGTLRAGHMKLIHMPAYPLVRAAPGFVGACLALHTPGVGADVTFHWQEIAE